MSAPSVSAHAPALIQHLRAHPDVQVEALPQRPGIAMYRIDFGRTLYLADTDNVLFLQLEAPITSISVAAEFLEFVSKYAPYDQIKLVSVPGIAPDVPFARLRQPFQYMAVTTVAELDADTLARGFEAAVASALHRSIKPELLVLYQFRGAVTGNRFFGREHQVQALLRHPRTSYLVTGARMSGKTSLLLETKRQLENQYRSDAVEIAYVDCREAMTVPGLFHTILLKLDELSTYARIERWTPSERWPQFFRYLRGRAKRTTHRRLYLFLDEFDHMVDLENRFDFNLT
ncbi:MAG TPA: AAA family ATPase, partial [Longimicrobium sp.]|nr:AAA family ATPase [Longimicrobium sp.]